MDIFDQVLNFINRPEPAAFDELALQVFTAQLKQIAAYRQFMLSRGIRPRSVREVADIPPVSTQAFKYARLTMLSEDSDANTREFLTSGTTSGMEERGRHIIPRPEIYRASATTHLRRMLFPDGRRLPILALHPTVDRMPESSLSQMISWAIEEFGTDSHCVATREAIDCESAVAFLQERSRKSEPVCIIATTAACAKLFSTMAESGSYIRLPPGSRLMDTGGAKGQVEPLNQPEVCECARLLLGIEPAMAINEYGMTEMCSQLYDATQFNSGRDDAPSARGKIAPLWLRPFAFDPASMKPMAEGHAGLLGFFDLANVGSVSMIVTEDLGMVTGGVVRILGRAGLAEARGCALGIEEFGGLS